MAHPTKHEQKALLSLLTRMYEDIRAVENEHGIYVSDKDLRPRVEYFHDAVRLYISGDERVAGDRLSVEYLAYDMGFLRHIHVEPVPYKGRKANTNTTLSSSQLAVLKATLAEQYKSYAVIYAALFADAVDRDYQDRVDDLNADVTDLAEIQQLVEQLAQGKGQAAKVMEKLAALGDKMLADLVKKMVQQKNAERETAMKAAVHRLKMMMNGKDKQIAKIDEHHMNFLAGQMYVYEDAKTTVKKLMSQGLNVAGQFVQSSAQQAQRTTPGRGR